MRNMNDLLKADFNLYKSFYFVAKEKSFSKAAECLFVTQPLISNNIKTLEEVLNVKLFDRSTKKVILTTMGQQLFEQIKTCYNILLEAERNIKMMQDLTKSEIKIGVTNDIGAYYASKIIKQYSKNFPQTQFCVLDKEKDRLIESLKNRSLDIIFISDPESIDTKNLCFDFIEQTQGCFVGPKDKVEDKMYSISDFNNKNFALPSIKSQSRKKVQSIFDQANININIVLETNSTNLGLELINENVDVSYFNEYYISGALEKRGLKIYKTDILFPKVNIYLAYQKNYNTLACESFVNFIKKKKQ